MLKKHKAKKQMEMLKEKAVKIKCCRCDLKDTCKVKINKEKSEKMGIITYCTLTPNVVDNISKKKKKKKWRKQII